MTRTTRVIAVLMGFAAWSTFAFSQTRPLAESLTGTAKSDYDSAKLLFTEGDFAGAELKFQGALNNSHDGRLYWNMAACEKSQHHYARAAQFVREYVEQTPLSGQERSEATAMLQVLEPLTVNLNVIVNVADAEIRVDGLVAGTSPLNHPVVVDLGAHKVAVHKQGFIDATKDVTLIEHDTKIDVPLTPATTTVVTQPTVTPQSLPTEPHARGVHFQLQLPNSGARANDRWVLRDPQAHELCVLPCQQWIGASSGDEIVLQRNGSSQRVVFPAKLPAGSEGVVRVKNQTGWHSLGVGFLVTGIALTTIALVLAPFTAGLSMIGAVWGTTFWIPGIAFLTVPSNALAIRTF